LLDKFGCGDKELNSGCESVKLYTSEHTEASVTGLKFVPQNGKGRHTLTNSTQ